MGSAHVFSLNRKYCTMQILNPLKTLWFLPLSQQSTHRFKLLEFRGEGVSYSRFIDDSENLNWSEPRENKFKTEGRRLHNAKLAFLIFKNNSTKFDFITAYVYSRMSDSGSICGLQYQLQPRACQPLPPVSGLTI